LEDAQHTTPNISLNLHGGNKINHLYWAAFCGIFLQFGMLVFSAFTVYHSGFRSRFPVDNDRAKPYAFPIMAIGTISLVGGMLICSAVVEYSTEEKKFVAGKKCRQQTGRDELNARILWLQKSHMADVVSDMAYDSAVIFGLKKNFKLCNYILASRRNTPINTPIKGWPAKIASSNSEAFTLIGVLLGICGFILQFEVG
jgi:hypothetical protein